MDKTVVVIDDALSMRKLVSLTLKKAGYDVLDFAGAGEALDVLKGKQANLVITDLNMPEIDGIELIYRLRTMPDYKKIPILMLTTESQKSKIEEGRVAGANGWLVKPFKPEQLEDIVKKYIT